MCCVSELCYSTQVCRFKTTRHCQAIAQGMTLLTETTHSQRNHVLKNATRRVIALVLHWDRCPIQVGAFSNLPAVAPQWASVIQDGAFGRRRRSAERERERVILECFPNQGLSLDFLFSFRWAYGTMGCGGIYLVCVESTSPLGKSWSSI